MRHATDRCKDAGKKRPLQAAESGSISSTSETGGAVEPTAEDPPAKIRKTTKRSPLQEKAAEAAAMLAANLEDVPKPKLGEGRGVWREARNGRYYYEDEFVDWYGPDRAEDEWADAPLVVEQDRQKDPAGVIGAALWPRGWPHRTVVLATGEIGVAAATTADSNVVADLVASVLRVRQAHFESEVGIEDPDAWDTGA